MISIVMCVHNEENYVSSSIKSILDQTYTDFELIVINDGSTDNTRHILDDYIEMDKRIRLIDNNCHMGRTKSLNTGITEAKGTYIAIMDAGDIAHPERLAKQVQYLDENGEVSIIGSSGYWIDKKKRIVSRWTVPTIVYREHLYNSAPVIHPSIMVRKSLYNEIGLYNRKYAEDFEFYARALKNRFIIANIPEYLINVRIGYNGIAFRHIKLSRLNIFIVKIRYLPYFLTLHNILCTIKSFIGCLLPAFILSGLTYKWIIREKVN